jgi:hypothetical protein
VKSAAAGKNAMPPKGGAADLTDDELKRVVAFLANKAGAGFKAAGLIGPALPGSRRMPPNKKRRPWSALFCWVPASAVRPAS